MFRMLSVIILKITLLGIVVTVPLTVGSGSNSVPPPTSSPVANAVTIAQSEDLFTPFILTVQPQTTVSWQNNDNVDHTVETTTDSSKFLNPASFSLTVPAGQTASQTFTKPGIYDYYDSSQASWNADDHRVAAKKGIPHYPLAMEGIIWVQGAIRGLPKTAVNTIPSGKDEFAQDFVAIKAGGSVSWHNLDTDLHVATPVTGWSAPINPQDFGKISIKGATATSSGGTSKITLKQPGLYYYYCPPHADLDPTTHRALAHKDASEYPIPMEGFILVSA